MEEEINFGITLLVDAKSSVGDAIGWLREPINVIQIKRHLLSAKNDIEKMIDIMNKYYPSE